MHYRLSSLHPTKWLSCFDATSPNFKAHKEYIFESGKMKYDSTVTFLHKFNSK